MKLTDKELSMISRFISEYTHNENITEIRLRRYTKLLDYDRPETADTIISLHLWHGYHTIAHLRLNVKNYPDGENFSELELNTSYSLSKDFGLEKIPTYMPSEVESD